MKKLNINFIAVTFFLPTMVNAQSLSVGDAYLAIPHQQTTYQSNESELENEKAQVLEKLFFHVDQAIVLKVEMMRLQKTPAFKEHLTGYEEEMTSLISTLQSLQADLPEVAPAISLIVSALQDHVSYFNAQGKEKNLWDKLLTIASSHPGDAYIQSSHQKLIEAYNLLMAAYPNETQKNKQAFFDHLCALDFI